MATELTDPDRQNLVLPSIPANRIGQPEEIGKLICYLISTDASYIVICTHDHADHIDPDGIPLISKASPNAQFLIPRCAMKTMFGYGIDEVESTCYLAMTG